MQSSPFLYNETSEADLPRSIARLGIRPVRGPRRKWYVYGVRVVDRHYLYTGCSHLNLLLHRWRSHEGHMLSVCHSRTLQASMAKLLCDLGKETTQARPGVPLTQAALDSYEKQLGTDQCPASSSIISYLKRLEMDQVIPSTDQPDPSDSAYQKGPTSDPSDDFIHHQRPEPTVSSIPSHSPQKLRPEVNSRICSLIGDEFRPDETTYLPLASSPHKAYFTPSARLMCTPPKVCSAERNVEDKINVFSASERNHPIPRSLFNDPAGQPTMTPDKPKPKEPTGGHPPPLLHHLRNLRITDGRLNDQSAFDVMSATSDWSIASFSTFTSHDEQDFRIGLAALDANIAKLQRTLQSANK